MSKAVDDILGFLRGEDLTPEAQAELIERLRDGEADSHKPAGQWVVTALNGALYSAEEAPVHIDWVHGPNIPADSGLQITFYHGRDDGKPVIQIDGSADFRINVNDCPVWDQSTERDYEVPEELKERLEFNARGRERKKVWVGVIKDYDGTWVYVGATEQAMFADMRANYGPVEFREESNHEWIKRVDNAGG
jgi:hypothetical protein